MKKIFIYYSLSGNGDIVAGFLKHTFDIRKVETKEPLSKNYILSLITGGFKALINYHDNLIDFDNNIEDYDEIVIGSPIWNDRLSSPINTVLEKLNLKNKKVKCILYSGSGKAKKAKDQLKKYSIEEIYILKEPINNPHELNKIRKL